MLARRPALRIDPPPGLRFVRMSGLARGKHYELTLSAEYSEYESFTESLGAPDANAKLLHKLLSPGGMLVDVGANIGTISMPIAAAGIPVVAVEMNPANCVKLWLSALRNGLRGLEIVPAAASDKDGLVRFEGVEAWGWVSSGDTGTPAVSLKLDTLLSRYADRRGPLVLKIDVEGHEAAVLRGGAEMIASRRPLILFESIEIEGVEQRGTEVRRILEAFGYNLFLIRHSVMWRRAPEDIQEGHVVDYLAVPSERRVNLARTGYEVRALTHEERLTWVGEMADYPHANHQRHAAGVVMRWRREDDPIYRKAGALIEKLRQLGHLSEVDPAA